MWNPSWVRLPDAEDAEEEEVGEERRVSGNSKGRVDLAEVVDFRVRREAHPG